jgi:hypothetical protein
MASPPFVRVFDSARFRTLVAGLLFVVGLLGTGGYLVSRAAEPLEVGQFGIDFADYRAAAVRIAEGGSPYDPAMLAGPIAAEGQDRYRYPPPFAQLLVPLARLPLIDSTWLWLAIQLACLFVAAWLAGSAAGLPRTLERLLWTGVAVTWFVPDLDTLWKGNVSGVQTLFVAWLFVPAGRVGVAGAAAAANALLKLTPLAMAPIAFLRSRRDALALVVVAVAVLAVSLVLAAPGAWSDYLTVVGNLLGGSADYPANLAPAIQLQDAFGLGAPWTERVGLATQGVGIGLLLVGIVWARRPGGWLGAATAGVAGMLLIPGTIWYHYLALLLPVAIVAWTRAGRRERVALLLGGTAVSVGVAWLPLASVGAAVLIGASLMALRPSPRA